MKQKACKTHVFFVRTKVYVFGHILGAFWTHFGRILDTCWTHLVHFGVPSLSSSASANPSPLSAAALASSASANPSPLSAALASAFVASMIEATNGGAAFFESILANKHKCWLAKMLPKNAAPLFCFYDRSKMEEQRFLKAFWRVSICAYSPKCFQKTLLLHS